MMQVKLWSECMKTGIFCHTESVAMTLKIMCTYAHYFTLGSRCKMASSHRVTEGGGGGEFQFESNLQGWSSDAIVSSWPFDYFLLVISWALLGVWRFSLFGSVYSSFYNRLDLIREPCLLLGVLFYFPNLSSFVLSHVKMKNFCSF